MKSPSMGMITPNLKALGAAKKKSASAKYPSLMKAMKKKAAAC